MVGEGIVKKTLADVLELLITRRRVRKLDLTIDLILGDVKIGSLHISGKIEHAPAEGASS